MAIHAVISALQKKPYSSKALPRGRRTVVDLLGIVSQRAKPGHLICDIDMSWASGVRARMLDSGDRVTITAFFLKAIALAQRTNPLSRTEVLPWGRRVMYKDIVAGFTVERDVERKPTVFFGEISDPDRKSLTDLASELKNYSVNPIKEVASMQKQYLFSGLPGIVRKVLLNCAIKIPSSRLAFQKSTFGLTSLGKYGIQTVLSPCICTSTFTVGSQEDRPVASEGVLSIRPMITMVLSFDQRVLDPIIALGFLNDVKALMEGGMSSHIPSEAS
jgi:pyruvate/2-oxoglutarate dehydrogenase complex dihydrolipoamide acyltransferase (E2) component